MTQITKRGNLIYNEIVDLVRQYRRIHSIAKNFWNYVSNCCL